jgi:signal transduction histidine kinase
LNRNSTSTHFKISGNPGKKEQEAMTEQCQEYPSMMSDSVRANSSILPLTVERIQGWFQRHTEERAIREMDIRLEERRKERARIGHALHDTLLQGLFGASMLLDTALEEMAADSPGKPLLSRAVSLMRAAIEEGRNTLHGLQVPAATSRSLEQSLAEIGDQLTHGGPRFRILVKGTPKPLDATVQEQVYLIGREALVNALRHAEATSIEVEIEYLSNRVRVIVRDNGAGINHEVLQLERDSHWGLLGMTERAKTIGGQLRVWSRRGAGTEVEISVADRFDAKA